MAYYKTCPNCGANLDPCERCDCMDNKLSSPSQTSEHEKNSEKEKSLKHNKA